VFTSHLIEVGNLSIARKRIGLRILILLQLKLVSVFVLLTPQKIGASCLGEFDRFVGCTALTLIVVELLNLILAHENSGDGLSTLGTLDICRFDKMLMLLFQILLEALKCGRYSIFLIHHFISIICRILAVNFGHFTFLKEMIFVQIWSGTLMLCILIADS
jgi:hypothetical protein